MFEEMRCWKNVAIPTLAAIAEGDLGSSAILPAIPVRTASSTAIDGGTTHCLWEREVGGGENP